MKIKSSIVKDIILSFQRYCCVQLPPTYNLLQYLQVDSILYIEKMSSLFIFALEILCLPTWDLGTLKFGSKWQKKNLQGYKT